MVGEFVEVSGHLAVEVYDPPLVLLEGLWPAAI
jgi:hypothetical protein